MDAWERVEELARENEVLKAEVARLQDRVESLRLGVGMVGELLKMVAFFRHFKRTNSARALELAVQSLNRFDIANFGEDGPSELEHRRSLGGHADELLSEN